MMFPAKDPDTVPGNTAEYGRHPERVLGADQDIGFAGIYDLSECPDILSPFPFPVEDISI